MKDQKYHCKLEAQHQVSAIHSTAACAYLCENNIQYMLLATLCVGEQCLRILGEQQQLLTSLADLIP